MNNEIEISKTKAKIWIYTFILFVSIGSIILFILSIYKSIDALGKDLSKKTYYYLDITNNKEEIIQILENDKIEYCDSLYKIEYYKQFPHGVNGIIYCKNKDNIYFDAERKNITKYIYNTGKIKTE